MKNTPELKYRWLLIIIALYSCSPKSSSEKERIPQSDSTSIDAAKQLGKTPTKEPPTTYAHDSGLSEVPTSVYDRMINGQNWRTIEMGGNPDTALSLFAYRMLLTDQREGHDDCEIWINMFERMERVTGIFEELFPDATEKGKVTVLIDSLNLWGLELAKNKVEEDIQLYGVSDGPCSYFVNLANDSSNLSNSH